MTKENFARLAFEGIACHMRAALESVRAGGVTVNKAMLIGGAAKSAVLAQILSDILQIPLRLPEPGEYVAKGAARQAAIVAGEIPGQNWEPQFSAEIQPKEENPAWERYLPLMEKLL